MISTFKKSIFYSLFAMLILCQISYSADDFVKVNNGSVIINFAQVSDQSCDDALDRMERGELNNNVMNPSITNWGQVAKIPALFVSTLFEPLTNLGAEIVGKTSDAIAAPFLDDGWSIKMGKIERGEGCEDFVYGTTDQLKAGVSQLAKWGKDKLTNTCQVVKENPLDALSTGVGIAVGQTSIAEAAPITTTVVATTVNAVRNCKLIYSVSKSIDGQRFVQKAARAGLYALGVYALSAIPAAAATSYHQWNSLADAQDHYNSKMTCYEVPTYGDAWKTVMSPVSKCLYAGGSLEQCQRQIPDSHSIYDLGKDMYAFTRHASANAELDPVSIVQLDGQKTCFLTALDTKSPVTKTCFDSLTNLDTRSVEVVPDLSLLRAHEGLQPGQSVRHVGLHLLYGGSHSASCGHFSQASAKYELGEKPACLLTALRPGGDVTQMCFDPNNPETLTVKPVEGISLNFEDNGGKPVSIVIKDPSKLGLNVKPEIVPPSQDSKTPSVVEGEKVCEQGKCYEYRKVEVPCNGKQEL